MRPSSILAAIALAGSSLAAQERAAPPPPGVVGTWDLTLIGGEGRRLPSWLELHWSGDRVLVGQMVGVVGSVRPISRLDFANDTLRWSLPPQWEGGSGDFQFVGESRGDGAPASLTPAGGREGGLGAHRPRAPARAAPRARGAARRPRPGRAAMGGRV